MATTEKVKPKTTKKSTKKVKPTKQAVKTVEKSQESPWYVFCSQGCGFCKKAEPVIEELNNEGYNILKLDVSEGDIIVFPSHWIHRGLPNNKERKTIISYNFSVNTDKVNTNLVQTSVNPIPFFRGL